MLIRILILVLISFPLFAERIAIADLKMIMQSASVMEDLNKQLEIKKTQLTQELSTKEEQLKKIDKDLSTQRDLLSTEAFEKKVNEFREQVISEQSVAQKKTANLEKSYVSALEIINDKTMDIVKEIAKLVKVDIVISKSQVLFFNDNTVDVSERVLNKLNDQLPKIEMKDAV